MSRAIWEVEVRGMYSGCEFQEALDQFHAYLDIQEDSIPVRKTVSEDLSQKLYMLCWQMSQNELFSCGEIELCLEAILKNNGFEHFRSTADIIDRIVEDVGHFDGMEEEDFLEWVTRN